MLQQPTPGRLRFQPSRAASSLPRQAPNERAENAGIPRRRHSAELPLLTHFATSELCNQLAIRRLRMCGAVFCARRDFATLSTRPAVGRGGPNGVAHRYPPFTRAGKRESGFVLSRASWMRALLAHLRRILGQGRWSSSGLCDRTAGPWSARNLLSMSARLLPAAPCHNIGD